MTATQDLKEELQTELCAVREELARREFNGHQMMDSATMVVPPRDHTQFRLKELTDDQLEEHKTRLERDLEDLDITHVKQLYRLPDGETDTADSD